jgi:hypothetical protein
MACSLKGKEEKSFITLRTDRHELLEEDGYKELLYLMAVSANPRNTDRRERLSVPLTSNFKFVQLVK